MSLREKMRHKLLDAARRLREQTHSEGDMVFPQHAQDILNHPDLFTPAALRWATITSNVGSYFGDKFGGNYRRLGIPGEFAIQELDKLWIPSGVYRNAAGKHYLYEDSNGSMPLSMLAGIKLGYVGSLWREDHPVIEVHFGNELKHDFHRSGGKWDTIHSGGWDITYAPQGYEYTQSEFSDVMTALAHPLLQAFQQLPVDTWMNDSSQSSLLLE